MKGNLETSSSSRARGLWVESWGVLQRGLLGGGEVGVGIELRDDGNSIIVRIEMLVEVEVVGAEVVTLNLGSLLFLMRVL